MSSDGHSIDKIQSLTEKNTDNTGTDNLDETQNTQDVTNVHQEEVDHLKASSSDELFNPVIDKNDNTVQPDQPDQDENDCDDVKCTLPSSRTPERKKKKKKKEKIFDDFPEPEDYEERRERNDRRDQRSDGDSRDRKINRSGYTRRKGDQKPIYTANDMERVLGVLKWFTVIVAILVIVNYKTSNSFMQVSTAQLNDLNLIKETILNKDSEVLVSNIEAFSSSDNARLCKSCHLNKFNLIRIHERWTYSTFVDYVRGKNRDIYPNAKMPHLKAADITDIELENIYHILKSRQMKK